MIERVKLTKFIKRLEGLIAKLERRKEPAIHQNISCDYYKQKCEGLKLLIDKFEETERRLEEIANMINQDYDVTFQQWRTDMRWLNTHQLEERSKAVL